MSLSVSSQTERKKMRDYYYRINTAYLDSFIHYLKFESKIDSIINGEKSKYADYNPILSTICFFTDSTFTSDQITTDEIDITIIDHQKKWNQGITLPLNHRIAIDVIPFCQIQIAEQSNIYNAHDPKSKELYIRQEIDQIDNITVLEKYKDKKNRKWVKLSCMLRKFDTVTNKHSENQILTGWTKAENIYIYTCY